VSHCDSAITSQSTCTIKENTKAKRTVHHPYRVRITSTRLTS